MVVLSLPHRYKVVSVVLREHFSMRERLNSSMVVMLMDLTVISFGRDFMPVWLDGLRGDSRPDVLLHISEVASARGVPGNSSLSSLHCCVGELKC